MDSIVKECSSLKHEYDSCFNEWFEGNYLKSSGKLPTGCDKLFQKYQECIGPKLSELRLNNQID